MKDREIFESGVSVGFLLSLLWALYVALFEPFEGWKGKNIAPESYEFILAIDSNPPISKTVAVLVLTLFSLWLLGVYLLKFKEGENV